MFESYRPAPTLAELEPRPVDQLQTVDNRTQPLNRTVAGDPRQQLVDDASLEAKPTTRLLLETDMRR
jgi:hypothetical protein